MEPITHDKRLQAIQYLSNGRSIRKIISLVCENCTIAHQERRRPAKNEGERKTNFQDQKVNLQQEIVVGAQKCLEISLFWDNFSKDTGLQWLQPKENIRIRLC